MRKVSFAKLHGRPKRGCLRCSCAILFKTSRESETRFCHGAALPFFHVEQQINKVGWKRSEEDDVDNCASFHFPLYFGLVFVTVFV